MVYLSLVTLAPEITQSFSFIAEAQLLSLHVLLLSFFLSPRNYCCAIIIVRGEKRMWEDGGEVKRMDRRIVWIFPDENDETEVATGCFHILRFLQEVKKMGKTPHLLLTRMRMTV